MIRLLVIPMTIVLMVFKLNGMYDYNWLVVFAPVLIYLAFWIVGLIVTSYLITR